MKWHRRYLKVAREVSTWSKDPSKKIGAVAVGEKGQILSQGYNGFPRGINDDDRLEDRPIKYLYVVHAEMNVIYNATFSGISLNGASLYVYGLPVCAECAKGIIQVGIKKVFIYYEGELPDIWSESWKRTMLMFHEVGIEFKLINLIDDENNISGFESIEDYNM